MRASRPGRANRLEPRRRMRKAAKTDGTHRVVDAVLGPLRQQRRSRRASRRRHGPQVARVPDQGLWRAKKLSVSVGRRPTEKGSAVEDHTAVQKPATDTQHAIAYECHDAVLSSQKKSMYGYLEQSATVNGAAVSAFLDSGASFNAVTPKLASRLNLPIGRHGHPLKLKLGAGRVSFIARRTCSIFMTLPRFPEYHSTAFDMELIGRNDQLGLEQETVTFNHPELSRSGRVCFGRRFDVSLVVEHLSTDRHLTLMKSLHSNTITYNMDIVDNKCFFIAPTGGDDKAEAAWRSLEGSSVYPLVSQFRDTGFRSELPDVPPSRQGGMDATIEVADAAPVHRKQFSLSPEQKAAIQSWLQDMLKAGIVRPSSSPYCAPTFCVRKSNGEWRIVHNFRGLNSKIRVPANPIPRKDDILLAMAHGKLFSALQHHRCHRNC
ncbi:hypothetical protein F441_01458 [Phytophthora nicotianae CJ01A1]|uniref:Peptidase A2 domain-containing protein n=1 Tax=Phytophthora nicotianae CJ01A1 TaxID=1317063 RepID=W2XSM4_PHYNI|nr:hypothetical protein F441_01458 [Phytophthora nicotianae CJ01A1]